MGTRIFNLEPPQGFAAQLAATGVLWYTGRVGFPISTTQVISGSVLGAGATTRASAVRWGVAANIVIAWVLTLPGGGARGRSDLRDDRADRVAGGTSER